MERIKRALSSIRLPVSPSHVIKKRASRVLGENGGSISNLMPWELGFECPLCHAKPMTPDGTINEVTSIHYSKYPGMLYCPACNINIPIFSCCTPHNLSTIEHVEEMTSLFLDFVEFYQKRAVHSRDDLEKVQEHANDMEWKKKYESLVESLKSPIFTWMRGDDGGAGTS